MKNKDIASLLLFIVVFCFTSLITYTFFVTKEVRVITKEISYLQYQVLEKLDIINKRVEENRVDFKNSYMWQRIIDERYLSHKQQFTPEELKNIIKKIAIENNFEDYNLLIKIAIAESSLNNLAIGKIDKRDRGLFQINSYYNKEVKDECAFCPYCSTQWVINEINNGNLWKWNASKHNWNK
jgi:hypothetical protein